MIQIKFGTDGWRAIIAKEYTVDNVKRVSEAACLWMKEKRMNHVVIGYDCRFAGKLFADSAAGVFGAHGIKVSLSPGFVSTPMVSLGIVKLKADLGVVITASHNPPGYNGYKLKASYGGPSIPKDVSEVEALIPDTNQIKTLDLQTMEAEGLLRFVDLEQIYIDHLTDHFDIDLLKEYTSAMAYDAMFGAGQNVMKKLFPYANLLHCDYNPSFLGTAPEPIDRNLHELSRLIKDNEHIRFGMANDGDADRVGFYDEDGKFVDSHRMLLLLLKYLYEYKGIKEGKVVFSFSVTDKMKKMAENYGLDAEITKIGFKYIAEIMSQEDVLIGGEESGGFAVKGHIPERDGIWSGLLLVEYMAKTGKSIKELIQEIYDEIGPFEYYRDDLHITDELKKKIIQACKDGVFSSFGPYQVVGVDNLDGFKYRFDETAWVMIRPSGTEPVLRVYAQGKDMQEVRSILDHTKEVLLQV